MTRIAILGCSSSKLSRPAPAAELYQGPLFKKSLAYARATCDDVRILSAKHQVVRPETVLEPYNESLVGIGRRRRRAWALACASQLALQLRSPATLVFLCGIEYRSVVPDLRRIYWIEEPLAAMGIGMQLHWLDAELSRLASGAP